MKYNIKYNAELQLNFHNHFCAIFLDITKNRKNGLTKQKYKIEKQVFV